ncbi:Sulfatase [Sphingopyxis sp. YR583]|uniref:sulfatase-like hydrolase/transferase n=1 Tax=Sphingopyxis sp. YR583 TaxID=1881047 RepID=UPI0008A7B1C8|nr:sulfatase-like hydrolase/transferase [Sphingopyxis sp. YR583]SEH19723.1 Sulfatase [Sphingopyxis sp. YR583]
MSSLTARVAKYPVAGILVTLIAVIAFWNGNQLRLGFESVWPTMASAIAVAAIVTTLFRAICGDWMRAGIASGFAAFYFFYIPRLLALLPLPFAAAAAAHVAVIAGLVLLYRALPSDRAKFGDIGGRINLLCALLLTINIAPLAVQQLRLEAARGPALEGLAALEGRAEARDPDVWHILFDRYAAADTLKSRYGFDNQPFVDALRQRGFVVQDHAYSNYQRTSHSVASTMNGVLLDRMGGRMTGEPGDWVPIYRAARDGDAIRRFNDFGYRTIFAGSWWEPTRFSTAAQDSIRIRALPQLARLAIDQSAAGFWLGRLDLPYFDGRGDQCHRANEKFRRLREVARDPARKHVFAHFLVPHPPFVLNADGSCRTLEAAQKASRSENYVDQVRFANREVLGLIDAILAGPRPAVIVLHSDEGPWPAPYVGDEHGLGTDPVPVPWSKLSDGQLREKMGILLAVRDPSGRAPVTMPASPVQIYPAILRDHFGSTQPLPPSRHYMFKGDSALYDFEDVSDRLAAN